ncbi:MAG: signal peptidase I [Syntrophales bacterium]|nr:signal peptidase I [Syntrophales bacterium]
MVDIKSKFREYAEAIVIAVLIAFFIRTFIIQAFKIPSGSMKPTLQIGDHILVTKFIYGIKIPIIRKTIVSISEPKRGDMVVFIYPEDRSKDFIKRVIGIGGDNIEIRNKKIYLNGFPYNDNYGVYTDDMIIPGAAQPRDNFGPVTVPPGSVFVMGDNRDQSYDSRFWGFVDLRDVLGKAFIIYWSWNSDEHNVRWSRFGHLLH